MREIGAKLIVAEPEHKARGSLQPAGRLCRRVYVTGAGQYLRSQCGSPAILDPPPKVLTKHFRQTPFLSASPPFRQDSGHLHLTGAHYIFLEDSQYIYLAFWQRIRGIVSI